MTEKTSVLIADDHEVVVEGIKRLLNDDPDFEVVGSAKDGQQALSMIKCQNPDIVILDILMPQMDGVEVARRLKEWNGKTKVLVYSISALKENIASLFGDGVSGYVLKGEPFSELLLALKTIRAGAVFYSASVRDVLQDRMKELEQGQWKKEEAKDSVAKLSAREKEVFVLLADGLGSKAIADQLGISPKTVESHKYNIMEKLNTNSIAKLTKIALEKKLIEI
ncbi:MAG: response regulator transcription factor [Deltaproteobacteria bacterium]|jgi:RNA polymerase sigma factor (sigma-70 family)